MAMGIVHTKPDIPREGSVVFADNRKLQDRCIYESGEFIGGGDFPVEPYILKNVYRWFYFNEYDDFFKKQGKTSYIISFKIASIII